MESQAFDMLREDFLEAVIKNMPEVPADIMLGWMEDPKALKEALKKALCPSERQNNARV